MVKRRIITGWMVTALALMFLVGEACADEIESALEALTKREASSLEGLRLEDLANNPVSTSQAVPPSLARNYLGLSSKVDQATLWLSLAFLQERTRPMYSSGAARGK